MCMKTTLRMCREIGIPISRQEVLNENCKICSKEILTELEKKYSCSSRFAFTKGDGKLFNIEHNPFIVDSDKALWIVNLEVTIRASKRYKVLVWLNEHKLVKNYCY